MAAVNPSVAGGPVGGGNMMMGGMEGAPNMQSASEAEDTRIRFNTYIYEYILKLGLHDAARALSQQQDKFKIRSKPKQSPGRRKDGESNGVDGDAMDVDKFDIPDDLPVPDIQVPAGQAEGFLVEWFGIFSDLFVAASKPKQPSMNPAHQYLMHAQQMQRMRETQQNPGVMRPGMMNNQYAMRANMQRNGMVNGAAMPTSEMAKRLTPQQMHFMQQKQMAAQQQQQMQREGGDVDMNGRPGTPTEGDNGGSPSKRPRLEGQQFPGGMMANGRPMPAGVPQGMMIQNSFAPQQMGNPQFRPNGAIPQQKPMQPGMPNGAMMNMNNASSPMMVGMNNGQFGNDAALEMYNTGRMAGQMPGGPAAQSGNHALQDYQMQLMLLEQQNKKRLMMARQEQDNQVQRDGAPMPMGATGMSPSGSRSGTSPNPTDQMKRATQLGGLPGSPSAGENMQGRSPAAMQFMNGAMPGGEFNPMFMPDKQGMGGPGAPNMRPPTSMNMQGRMGAQFQGGQPMAQNPSQSGQQPMGTPGQRNEMPPPQAPAGGAQRTASSPAQSGGNAPPTPSQTNKPNPKGKKGKDDNSGTGNSNKKKPAKKNSQANASNDNQTTTAASASVPAAPVQQLPPAQPPMQQPDLSQNSFSNFDTSDQQFNLDFSTLDNTDVLENFDFDSFLNTSTDDTFNFDGGMVGNDFSLDAGGD